MLMNSYQYIGGPASGNLSRYKIERARMLKNNVSRYWGNVSGDLSLADPELVIETIHEGI